MLKSSPIGDVIIELTEIDSTNNYAMRLINEGMAEHGHVVSALYQTSGKGQHGHHWESAEANNLLFSIILDTHTLFIDDQFALNAMTAVTVAEFLSEKCEVPDISIKWPNDIYAGKKKISGTLIENHLRGSSWMNSVVGIGINVNQRIFPDLPNATSILQETEEKKVLHVLLKQFLQAFQKNYKVFVQNPMSFLNRYNQILYRSGENFLFREQQQLKEGRLLGVLPNGQMEVEWKGHVKRYQHREIEILLT